MSCNFTTLKPRTSWAKILVALFTLAQTELTEVCAANNPSLSHHHLAYARNGMQSEIKFLEGFSGLEDWGVWTDSEKASLTIAEDEKNIGKSIQVKMFLRAFLPTEDSVVKALIKLTGPAGENEKTKEVSFSQTDSSPEVFISYRVNGTPIRINFDISGSSSPFATGISGDTRNLGIGIEKLTIDSMRYVSDQISPPDGDLIFYRNQGPEFKLFKPLQYKLQTTYYGENPFPAVKEWINGDYKAEGGEVYELPHVCVVAGAESQSAVFNLDSGKCLHKKWRDQQKLLKIIQSPSQYFKGETCVFRLDFMLATHYYDFMTYYLPAIHFLSKRYPEMKFFMHKNLRNYEAEAFNKIGLDRGKLLFFEDNMVQGGFLATFEKLFLVSFSNVFWKKDWTEKEFYNEQLDLLRETFLPHDEVQPCDKKIYITRDDVLMRGVLSSRSPSNEDEVREFLKTQGFDVVCLTGMSVQDQANLFNRAKVIIGPHGAGFANIIFCQKGAKLLELMSSSFFSLAYVHLCSILGMEHHSIICPDRLETNSQANFQVSTDDLKEFLQVNGLYAQPSEG